MSLPLQSQAITMAENGLDINDEKEFPALRKTNRSHESKNSAKARIAAGRGNLRTSDRRISEQTSIDLLLELQHNPSSANSTANIRHYVERLNLQSETRAAAKDIEWNVSTHPVEELTKSSLPRRQNHSGQFDWIGNERGGLPRYLWDSHTRRTVLATAEHFNNHGYIAVSWTWGRFQQVKAGQKQTRGSAGTSWLVPKIMPESRSWFGRKYDLVHDLKQCLAKLPNRYFWIDVLCINQEDENEKAKEIDKQARIFRQADGVLCYLWNQDDDGDLRTSLEGLGTLLRWALVFGNKVSESRDAEQQEDARKRYAEASDRLRQDMWFSSLWALQEIVLAPAGIWMTRHGRILKVNNEWLTTRLLAMIIRVLSWAGNRRSQLWSLAERDCRKERGLTVHQYRKKVVTFQNTMAKLTKSFVEEQGQYEGSRGILRNRPHQISASISSVSSSPNRSTETNEVQPNLIVEVDDHREADVTPWAILRYAQEAPLRHGIEKWVNWSFGTACIDISLSATRAAILVAGLNRTVVQGDGREAALLSALKIAPDDRFLMRRRSTTHPVAHANTKRLAHDKHLSPFLMNVMLRGEGLGLFNVEHHVFSKDNENDAPEAFTVLSMDELPEESGYAAVNIQTYAIRRSQYDRAKQKTTVESTVYNSNASGSNATASLSTSVLTNMFPATACNLNTQVLDFDAMYEWLGHERWHLHHGGIVHIPCDAVYHTLPTSRKTSFELRIRSNGDHPLDYRIQSIQDLKRLSTLSAVMEIMNALQSEGVDLKRPPFMFIPFGKLKDVIVPEDDHGILLKDAPASIGVVLVGGAKVKMHSSLTRWYKFGNYSATGLTESKFVSKEGLIVVSYEERNHYSLSMDDCESLRNAADQHFRLHDRVRSTDTDYEMVDYKHVLPKRQQTTLSNSSFKSRRRSIFAALKG